MSDHQIILIAEDPRFVPEVSKQKQAREWFAKIAPTADEINITVSEHVKFFCCGENFERIICPACGSEINIDWWVERMDEDHSGGVFKLNSYATPCCNKKYTLHELHYELPQGFGCFAIEALNPEIGELEVKDQREFENILGTKLRVIYVWI